MTDPKPTPIVSPIIALLRSRKAMTTLIGIGISLLVPFAPGLEEHRADLLEAGLIVSGVLASVLALAIGMEDSAAKGATTIVNAPSAGDTNVTTPPAG